ncbi:SNF7 family protein [Dictyostelium discoideum AX4]|uniref:Charged multivesicular body protein 7 n=1 Tax=Dictyostelium discoideum TaxID=44689 RepID=CHMP7_DICDI|nr:SNF7 family protein [Dictyostelium discoideum AX4]Q86K93.1 RecName: Full=Charged multivesicular body protein 7 [Dictyostelium discoideum]EAL68878.1 SNF7 family protein [Dictyostelium discoideum AX4]|eukprot:XP_642803.1 SNF7 family protein [Dictyostelium discoideum AX4]
MNNDKEINSEKSKRAINHFSNKKEIKNSDRRGILFSKLPSQQLNPDRYDNLMTFWNNSLIDISKSCNILIFTPKLLSTYFTVENVSPIYLPLILNEMIKTKFIVKYEEYIKDYGWSKWVWTKMVVQPFQYYTGLSTPNTETEKNVKFILPEMIKDKAEQLYQHQLKNMNSTTDNIISYINLEKSIKDWYITREELDLLLLVLFRDSKVLILTNNKIKNINNNNNGEDRIGIKFAFDGEKVQPIQETDFGILKLQTTYETLKQQESKLLTDIEEISNTIKESIRIKQKNHALLQLKKKKLLESILEKRATASTNIHEILFSIESAKSNQQIIESLCTGVSTLKKVNQEISVDQVDSILDDYQDAITNQREIDDAMKSGFNSVESLSSADIDEDQLEKELDQMLQDHLTLEKEEKQKQKQIEKEKQQQQQPPTSQFNPNLPIPLKNEEDELLKELESLSVTSNPLPKQDENKQKTSELI